MRIEADDKRTAAMLPRHISRRMSEQLTLVVLGEPLRTGAAGQADPSSAMPTEQEPNRPPPVPLPRPRPPLQGPTGAVIIDTIRPPEVLEGYDVHIHVPTQYWYFA